MREKQVLIRTALLLFAGLFWNVTTLHACSCVGNDQPCQDTWSSDAVFAGRVLRITNTSDGTQHGEIANKRVTFHVAEAFRGTSGDTTVDVETGPAAGGDCGFPFQTGKDYLVYASRSPGQSLTTSICTRTGSLESATLDLGYLRSLDTAGLLGRIDGLVSEYTSFIWSDLRRNRKAPLPLANVKIRLESPTFRQQASTNSSGYYSFEELPAGEYRLSADMPDNLMGGEQRTVKLTGHACSQEDFVAQEKAQLTGRVVDDRRVSLETEEVALVSITGLNKSKAYSAYSYEDGIFIIQHVPPGDYVLGVNISTPPRAGRYLDHPFPPTYFPGVPDLNEASIIHVESGQVLSGFELQLLPRLKQRTITGSLIWPDGKPAFGAYVELRDAEFPRVNVELGNSLRDGTFTVTGVVGRQYSISAVIGISEGQKPFHSETIQLKPDQNGSIRLVLSLPGTQ